MRLERPAGFQAPRGGDREWLERTTSYRAGQRTNTFNDHTDPPPGEVLQPCKSAGIGNEGEVCSRLLAKQLTGQMRQGAMAVGRIEHAAGVFPGESHEVRQRTGRHRRRGGEHHRRLGDEADVNKVTIHVDRKIPLELRHDDERRYGRNVERVPVRFRGGGRTGGRHAPCPGMVEDRDWLLPKAAEPVGDKAGNDVRATAGSALGDDPDRPGRVPAATTVRVSAASGKATVEKQSLRLLKPGAMPTPRSNWPKDDREAL